VTPPVPKVEVADDADPLSVWGPDHEGDAADALHIHRVRAQLVVKREMITFAEQIKIEVGKNGRKAIGIFQFDLAVPEAGAQMVVGRIVDRARKKAGRVDPFKLALGAIRHRYDALGIRQEHAHDRMVVLGVRAEIVERVGIAACNDLTGADGKFAHDRTPRSARMRSVPSSGICAQLGRLVTSYSIS
jgi:hypothetical protein